MGRSPPVSPLAATPPGRRPSFVPLLGALLCSASLACATGGAGPSGASPQAPSAPRTATDPGVPIRALLDVCWPQPGLSADRVTLTFVKQGGQLRDVWFETTPGVSNGIGRCLQELAWRYPWGATTPDSLILSPPAVRPSGWTYLAYASLLAEGHYAPDRGLLRAAPLVRACLVHAGPYRDHLRFRVQPNPVRVSVFSELQAVDAAAARRTEADAARTSAERCVGAVLASAVYPGSRSFELDLSDLAYAPAPAAVAEVAPYVEIDSPPAPGTLDLLAAREGLAARQPAIATCWEAALGRRSGLAGARTLRLLVAASGEITSARVAPNASDQQEEANDFLLDRCLVGSVTGARLSAPKGGPAELAYSWVFAHR